MTPVYQRCCHYHSVWTEIKNRGRYNQERAGSGGGGLAAVAGTGIRARTAELWRGARVKLDGGGDVVAPAIAGGQNLSANGFVFINQNN